MDNAQAAAVLRKYAAYWATKLDRKKERKAAERGADALEMLEWLFKEGPWGRFCWRVMYDEWNGNGSFLAYCEARFEESKKHGL